MRQKAKETQTQWNIEVKLEMLMAWLGPSAHTRPQFIYLSLESLLIFLGLGLATYFLNKWSLNCT